MDEPLFEELPVQDRPETPRGSRPRVRAPERRQVEWRALSLDDLLPAEHRARLVWAFVERLDLGPLYAAIQAVEGRGLIRLLVRGTAKVKAVLLWFALAHTMPCLWRLAPGRPTRPAGPRHYTDPGHRRPSPSRPILLGPSDRRPDRLA